MMVLAPIATHPWRMLLWCAVAIAPMFVVGPVSVGMLLLLVAGMVLSYCQPSVVLAILAMTIPLQDVATWNLFGVELTWTRAVLVMLLGGWVARGDWARAKLDATTWAYGAILVALIASIVSDPSVGGWAAETYRWLAAAVVYVVARSAIRTHRDAQIVTAGVAIGVLGASMLGFAQVLTRDGPPSFVVNGVLRAYATFGEPNPFAAYLELSLFLLLAYASALLFLGRGDWTRKCVALPGTLAAVAALGLLALLLTQSRGGWLGFVGGSVVMLLILPSAMRWRAIVLGVVLGSVMLVSPLGSRVIDRVESIGASNVEQVSSATWANEERRAHWGAAISMIEAHPWTGVGAGAFDDRFREYTPAWRFRIGRGHAHNGYLQMAAQAGIPALLAFVWWILAMVATLIQRLRSSFAQTERAAAVAGLATVVAFCIHSTVDYLNVLSLGIQLSLVVAVTLVPARTGTDTCVHDDSLIRAEAL